ncbi:LOW QUALITY PROTEIN: nuclear pore membrane glycoprotein 210-like [Theristicus caerulescens]
MAVPCACETEGSRLVPSSCHDIVTVEPVDENGAICSQKALVSAQPSRAGKLSSVVTAEECVTGHLLPCDVSADTTDSIEIISQTELCVDDSSLELAVRALDVEELELPLGHYELELRAQVIAPVKETVKGNRKFRGPILSFSALTSWSSYLGPLRTSVFSFNKMEIVKEFLYKNKDVPMRAASGLPNCTIYVVEAGFLGNKKMKTNLRITHHFSKEYFEKLLSSHNGSYHIEVLKDGITGIKAELVSVLLQVRGKGGSNFRELDDGSEVYFPIPVSREQEVKIYLPIKLSPSFLAFPHHPMEVIPLQPGFLSLEIYDLCLGFLGPVRAYLRVSDLRELEVDLTDKVMQSSGSSNASKTAEYFPFYQVFPPFKLIPKKITLIPHNMMQVSIISSELIQIFHSPSPIASFPPQRQRITAIEAIDSLSLTGLT